MHHHILLFIGLLTAISVSGLAKGAVDNEQENPIHQAHGEVATCATPECREAVDQVRSSIDESFDPCQDFYQYACGGWIRNQSTKLREDTGSITELDVMDKLNIERITKLIEDLPLPESSMPAENIIESKIKLFYNSCINQTNILQIFRLLTKSDNFTSSNELLNGTIPGIRDEEMKEWEEIMKELHPNPGSLLEYLKFVLESQENDTEAQSTLCTHFARELFPEGVAKLFVTSHYLDDPEKVAGVRELIGKIWTSFYLNAHYSYPWTDDFHSQMNMSLSIANMTVVSGYLNDTMNSSHVEGLYANVSISDNFLLNLKELIRFSKDRKKDGQELNLQFYKDTTKATAFYVQLLDTIFIPAGIVQIPTFHHSFPDVLKLAKLGTTVARAFAHSFQAYIEGVTLENSYLDTPIVIRESVVSSSSREVYRNRSQCVVEQYEGIEVPLSTNCNNCSANITEGIRINGTLTMKESIADILGIQIAFGFGSFMKNTGATFQPIPGLSEKFSKEQIFFIASAQGLCHAYRDAETEVKLLREQVTKDVHSPSSVRVLGSLRNFDEFSKAFNCPLGSTYNPEKKCTFFGS